MQVEPDQRLCGRESDLIKTLRYRGAGPFLWLCKPAAVKYLSSNVLKLSREIKRTIIMSVNSKQEVLGFKSQVKWFVRSSHVLSSECGLWEESHTLTFSAFSTRFYPNDTSNYDRTPF